MKAAEAEEDQYWFEREFEFVQIQSEIMLACNRDEMASAIADFQTFLEKDADMPYELKNIGFINRYLTTIAELLNGVVRIFLILLGDFVNGLMRDVKCQAVRNQGLQGCA